MSQQCTWVDPPEVRCSSAATHAELSNDKTPWAHTCDIHHAMIEDGIVNFTPQKMLRNWVRAQGGHKAAAARMMR
jgi:hypothetical protein